MLNTPPGIYLTSSINHNHLPCEGTYFLVKQVRFVVSSNFLENTWQEWPEMWHADVSWPHSEIIKFWSQSVDCPNFCCVHSMALCLFYWPLVAEGAAAPRSLDLLDFDVIPHTYLCFAIIGQSVACEIHSGNVACICRLSPPGMFGHCSTINQSW